MYCPNRLASNNANYRIQLFHDSIRSFNSNSAGSFFMLLKFSFLQKAAIACTASVFIFHVSIDLFPFLPLLPSLTFKIALQRGAKYFDSHILRGKIGLPFHLLSHSRCVRAWASQSLIERSATGSYCMDVLFDDRFYDPLFRSGPALLNFETCAVVLTERSSLVSTFQHVYR